MKICAVRTDMVSCGACPLIFSLPLDHPATLEIAIDRGVERVEAARGQASRTGTLSSFVDNSVRRTWITTLQKLRARAYTGPTKDVLDTWMR